MSTNAGILRPVLAGSIARVLGGVTIVAAAVVVALAVGGSGVLGGLGSVFAGSGSPLEVAKKPAADDIVAVPAAAATPAPRAPAPIRRHPTTKAPGALPTPQPVRPLQPMPPSPPAPHLPPAPAPAPLPGAGQIVNTGAGTVQQLVHQAPPALQPVTGPVSRVVDTVVRTCRGLPVCP